MILYRSCGDAAWAHGRRWTVAVVDAPAEVVVVVLVVGSAKGDSELVIPDVVDDGTAHAVVVVV